MTPSTYNTAIAAALEASSAISTFCTTAYGRGCLIQEQENPGEPLELQDAPWICCLIWPQAELGAIIDANSCEIVLTAGVGSRLSIDAPALAQIISTRTTTLNGRRRYGNPADAEALLKLAIDAAKLAIGDGSIISSSRIETDGWLHFPLQIASAVLTIKEYTTL